jgi:hypothetical protein
MIPRLIHFVWIGGPLPDWAARNVEEFRKVNPGFAVKVHGEEAILPELAAVCAGAAHPSSKADLVRLSVLSHEGGWYFDVDYWPLRPLEEAVWAWGLDGRRVFVSRQNHIKVPLNNCMMASAPGAAGIGELISTAQATPAKDRCCYGPDLLSAVYARKPGLFAVADWPWFMPMRHKGAASYWQRALRGDVEPLRQAEPRTGGQLPFALHLWLNGCEAEILQAFKKAPDTRPFALVEECPSEQPMSGMAEGLHNFGLLVRRYHQDDEMVLERMPVKPCLLVAWNNIRRSKLAASAARHGVPALWCENGFLDRKRYIQVDPEGFLHRSGWRRLLGNPAPVEGAEKLARFYPKGTGRITARMGGYILVLGQVAGDTQMVDSELQGSIPLQRELIRALPKGAAAYFRPHPQASLQRKDRTHVHLPLLDERQEERAGYRATKSGSGLADALSQASFVVTINSNAAVEALAAGVPVLAFGPHLGIDAGVIRRCTVATLAADIQAMHRGWCPEQARVDNFLRWLAARQWCREEFANPAVMGRLLAEAGVTVGGGVGSGSLPGPGPSAPVAPEGKPEEERVRK